MLSATERAARVKAQQQALPQIYGSIDFDRPPLRFTTNLDVPSQMRPSMVDQRPRLLANDELVAALADYTMLGDRVGDAYATLMGEYRFSQLVDMLVQACRDGVANVEGAPPELVAFIADMERVPEWIDMDLVRRGAQLQRNSTAHVLPFAIRGAFIGTFLNKYAALPMARTGALSEKTSGKRIKETAAFFASSTLPGALERDGHAFQSAAMVRLMHSMVRFNVMRRGHWDSDEYGVPIPQADQMPAGLSPMFLLSLRVLSRGRDQFTADERATVEFYRYRCYLLGLPEELMPTTPQAIVDIMATRHATLRAGWDKETCGRLVQGTMAASFEPTDRWSARMREPFEKSFSKVLFMRLYAGNQPERATEMGVHVTTQDRVRAAGVGAYVAARMLPFAIARRVPMLRDLADRRLTAKIAKLLTRYSGAEFRTDAASYQPT
jgi:hypothetical protein